MTDITDAEAKHYAVRNRQLWFSQAIINGIEIVVFLYLIGWTLDLVDTGDNYFLQHPYYAGNANGISFPAAFFGYLWLEGVDLIVGLLLFAFVGQYIAGPFFRIKIGIHNNFPEHRKATACYLLGTVLSLSFACLIAAYDEAGTFDILFLVLLAMAVACWLGTSFSAFVRYGMVALLIGIGILGATAPDDEQVVLASVARPALPAGGPLFPTYLVDNPAEDAGLLHKVQAARFVNTARRSAISAIRRSLRGAVVSPLRGGVRSLASSTSRGAKRLIKMVKQLIQQTSDWTKEKLFPKSRGRATEGVDRHHRRERGSLVRWSCSQFGHRFS